MNSPIITDRLESDSFSIAFRERGSHTKLDEVSHFIANKVGRDRMSLRESLKSLSVREMHVSPDESERTKQQQLFEFEKDTRRA